MWRGRRDVCVYTCVTAYAYSVCVRVTIWPYVHTHACICTCLCVHKQTSICASNTAGLCDGMSRYNPHSLEKYLSLSLSLSSLPLSQSYTYELTYSLYKQALKHSLIKFFPLLLSLTAVSIHPPLFPSLPPLPLPCSPGHTFQAELQPARTRSVALVQSPEELLSTIACLCQAMCCKNMSPCRFVCHPFTHPHQQQQPQKLYTKIHVKIWYGPFPLCFTTYAICHKCSVIV